MLEFVFFILGVLIGQFALLFYARSKLGYEGWQAVNSFYDAWLDGDVELTQDDDGDDNTVNDSRNDGVKARHDHADRDEDDLK